MPEYGPYLRGFGIKKGMKMAGYQLESIGITHDVVKINREYNYDVVLNFVAVDNDYNVDELLDELDSQTNRPRIIFTRFGNPYRCWFQSDSGIEITSHNRNYSRVKLLCQGYAKRIYRVKKSHLKN